MTARWSAVQEFSGPGGHGTAGELPKTAKLTGVSRTALYSFMSTRGAPVEFCTNLVGAVARFTGAPLSERSDA